MTRPLYNPRTDVPYFSHQLEQCPQIRVLDTAAMFWRTGTGKTRADLEDTAWQYCNSVIDQALVIAPGEVHRRTWVDQQGPAWLQVPDARIVEYTSPSNASSAKQRELDAVLTYKGDDLIVLCMYYEAFASKSGQMYAEAFVERGRTKITLDESHRIMTAGSVSSGKIRALRWGKNDVKKPHASVARIMTATPTANSLEDLYAQYKFLNPEIIGCSTKVEFIGMFVHKVKIPGTHFMRVVGHRNVKYLNKRIAPYTFVAKKPEGMPKQLWRQVATSMSDEQWKAYRELKKDYQTQLRNGQWVDGELSIVRLKRLQQIVAGHITLPNETDEKKTRQVLQLECPRIQDTIDRVKGCPDKVIVWAQEHFEITRLHEALNAQGVQALMYYGKMKKGAVRDAAIDQFEQDPDVKVLVANDATGGTGLTIVGKVAPVSDQIFYSHTWSRILREQCEGRNHRMDLHNVPKQSEGELVCMYHDMIAFGTTDIRIRERVQLKNDIAQLVEDPREIAKLLDDDLDYMVTELQVAV